MGWWCEGRCLVMWSFGRGCEVRVERLAKAGVSFVWDLIVERSFVVGVWIIGDWGLKGLGKWGLLTFLQNAKS